MNKQKRSVNYALRIDTEIVDDNLDIKSRQSLFFSAFSHFYRYALFIYMCVLYSIHTHTQHQACCWFFVVVVLLCSLYVMPLFFPSFIVIYWLWWWFLFIFIFFLLFISACKLTFLCRKRECGSANWMKEKMKKKTNEQNFLSVKHFTRIEIVYRY